MPYLMAMPLTQTALPVEQKAVMLFVPLFCWMLSCKCASCAHWNVSEKLCNKLQGAVSCCHFWLLLKNFCDIFLHAWDADWQLSVELLFCEAVQCIDPGLCCPQIRLHISVLLRTFYETDACCLASPIIQCCNLLLCCPHTTQQSSPISRA